MQATSKDLRFHTKEILDAAMRGEEVIITYHGKPCAKIIPMTQETHESKENASCSLWKDRTDLQDVDGYVRNLRLFRQL